MSDAGDLVRLGMALARAQPDRREPSASAMVVIGEAATGAVPILMSCDDGQQYWSKGPGNPHGNLCLAHEWVISELSRVLGSPLCHGILMDVDEELVAGMTVQGKPREPGIWFGSRLVRGEEATRLQFAHRDGNPARIPHYLALRHLCLGVDEQFIFERADEDRVWSIDHGLWFSNADGDWTDWGGLDAFDGQAWPEPEGASDPHLDPRAFHDAANAVLALSPEVLGEVTGSVPVDWGISDNDLERLALFIYRRRELVAHQLRARASHR